MTEPSGEPPARYQFSIGHILLLTARAALNSVTTMRRSPLSRSDKRGSIAEQSGGAIAAGRPRVGQAPGNWKSQDC